MKHVGCAEAANSYNRKGIHALGLNLVLILLVRFDKLQSDASISNKRIQNNFLPLISLPSLCLTHYLLSIINLI